MAFNTPAKTLKSGVGIMAQHVKLLTVMPACDIGVLAPQLPSQLPANAS